ncbi:CoA-binding protein [Psychroflexus aestuariivivens]|uniref:CoA-binding protein n=1 Tax=Psychroflexus aestuariivivens TaxID=1795040 RepID=UPI000FDC9280|nr:CoA-binding protein [Psychroflexus aestuariivivens]
MKKTLIIGVSENENRYANRVMKILIEKDYEVIAIGKKPGEVSGVKIRTKTIDIENLHTVTLYISPEIQKEYYDYIIAQKPNRVIFNPGSNNKEFQKLLEAEGIQVLNSCSLIMLTADYY